MSRYAIFRTRFQPFNVGHKWAIDQFFSYVDIDIDRIFGCTHLWLAIVDPEIYNTRLAKEHPRALPELNPLKEWQVAELIQLMTCKARFHCDSIVQIRIPSFMSVRSLRKNSFRRILGRIPKDHVWFFPVFDWEDVLDVELIWQELGSEKIIIAHHPQFQFDLIDPMDNKDRKIGIYAAASAEMLSFSFRNKIMSVIPQEVQKYYRELNLTSILKGFARSIIGNNQHPFLRDDRFAFIEAKQLVYRLQEVFNSIYPELYFDDYVKFLPPDIYSESYAQELCKNIRNIDSMHNVVEELQFKLTPTVERLSQIVRELQRRTDITKDEMEQLERITGKYSK